MTQTSFLLWLMIALYYVPLHVFCWLFILRREEISALPLETVTLQGLIKLMVEVSQEEHNPNCTSNSVVNGAQGTEDPVAKTELFRHLICV